MKAFKVFFNFLACQDNMTLHESVVKGDKKMCDYLLKKGADVNAQNESGWTPLIRAVSCNKRECFDRILEEKKVNVNLVNKWGKNALHYAALWGDEQMCDYLLKKGADVNAQDNDGDTPLICSIRFNKKECFDRILEEKKVDVNLTDKWGENALHCAARLGDEKLCDVLLRKGASVDAKDKNGETPLKNAFLNNMKCLKILSEKAADLRGALEIAERYESLEAIKILKWTQKMHLLKIRKCTRKKSKIKSI